MSKIDETEQYNDDNDNDNDGNIENPSEIKKRGLSKAQQFLKKTIYNKKMRFEELCLNLYPFARKIKEIPLMVEEIIRCTVEDAPEIKRICFETGYGHTQVAIQIRKVLGKHLMHRMNYLMETSGNPGTFKMLDDLANRIIVFPKLAFEQNNEHEQKHRQRYGYRNKYENENENENEEDNPQVQEQQKEKDKKNVEKNNKSTTIAPNPNSKSQIKKRYKLQNKIREKQKKKEKEEKERQKEQEEEENRLTNIHGNDNENERENEKDEEEMLGSFLWQMQSLTVAGTDKNGENKKLDRMYNIPAKYFKPKKKSNNNNNYEENRNQTFRSQSHYQRRPLEGQQNSNTDMNCYNVQEQRRILEEIENQHKAIQESQQDYRSWIDINAINAQEQSNILQSIQGQERKSRLKNRANNFDSNSNFDSDSNSDSNSYSNFVSRNRNGNPIPSYWEPERNHGNKQNKNITMPTHNFSQENNLEKSKNKNKNKKKSKPQPQPQPERVDKVPPSNYRETTTTTTIQNTNKINPAWIEYLTGMGFNSSVVQHAIAATNYAGISAALDYLLTCSK